MRLVKVRVTDFKSVRDSGEFNLGDVTCLVGKNEAGKTAVLEAIYRLHPIIASHGNFDVTHDYPRVDVEDYQHAVQTGKKIPAKVITAVYELADTDVTPVEQQFGAGLFVNRFATLQRGYENKTTFVININEGVAVRHLVGVAELPDDFRANAMQLNSLKELGAALTKAAAAQDKAHKEALATAAAIEDAAEQAKAKDDANKLQESQTAKQLRADIPTYLKDGFTKYIWHKHLDDKMPEFLYFDEYYQMEGQVNIQKLKERQAAGALLESDRPMLGLVDLARLDLDQLLAAKDTQALLNKIEGASNHLSKQVLKYWSQNKHILVRFDLRPALAQDPEGMREGTNLWGFVHDTKHLATTRLGTRSRGFIWFFSFLAWFSQQRKLDKPLILLLDEPGLFLHASAQADLLRYIEQELKPHHQVIYTTHSPFMVEPTDFSRVRIVRDKSMESDEELSQEQQGTKVFTDVLEADEGSLFPLQGALGYDIAQTLFIGPNCLIVEGVSDLLYLPTLSGVLAAQRRDGLLSAWTITPVGGSDKVTTFVSLLGSQKKLNLATLIDFQKKDQQTIENLYKRKLLAKKNVRTFAEFTNTAEADLEDMFDRQFYLDLVNAEYAAELQKPIGLADLGHHPRVLVNIEEHLKANPLKTGGFNHYRPARYFAENIGKLGPMLDAATLNRFEAAFKALNALL
jgi:predicted ATP-dependent endonuclease of OLD family